MLDIMHVFVLKSRAHVYRYCVRAAVEFNPSFPTTQVINPAWTLHAPGALPH